MNIYELIEDLYTAHSYITAGSDGEWPYKPVLDLVAAYDALAPDWSQAPEGAKYYAIDAPFWRDEESESCFYPNVPHLAGDEWHGESGDITWDDKCVILPPGIDWRLCIWQRPEVQP